MKDECAEQQSGCACCSHEHNHIPEDGGRAHLIKIAAGTAVFIMAILISRLLEINEYISLAAFVASYIILGGNIILRAAKNIAQGQVFDENFLMGVATIGAFLIGEYPEAVAVMLFYQVGEYFQERAVYKSKKSIADLMDIRPDYANLKTETGLVRVSPETVKVGDIIVVKAGKKIPLDGIVAEGEATLDTSALTGESVPRKVSLSDPVLSGCVNQNGLLTIEVTKGYGDSTALKIIDLVENAAAKKAPTEKFITKFARYYTPVVVGLAALIAVIPPLLTGAVWADWIYRGLVFLVISCPCALVISIPLSFFAGIGASSKHGILVKGGNYLEALSGLEVVVFDKTGTLTKGVFAVTSVQPAEGFDSGSLLEAAAYAEAFCLHPIALSITKEYGKALDKNILSGYREIAGLGVSVTANGKTILAGNKRLLSEAGIAIFPPQGSPGTIVHVAVDGVYAGHIVISDEIKEDSKNIVFELKSKGVKKTVMLTGDTAGIAEAVASELQVDEVYSGLLPGEKVEKVEFLNKGKAGKLAFVGDGINDAPVLAIADVGVAMGGLGSDAAIEAADVVLMTDEPSKLAKAVDIARYTKRIIGQNIVFILGVKGAFLLLGALGIATMWAAVFADVGVAVLAVLNSMRVLRKMY